ncbi:hypothetical protein L0P85_06500 [Terrisporobacter glycolicus]|nr:hypothetical protein L0P85_06500 [Terrisporobacter glycolicus]
MLNTTYSICFIYEADDAIIRWHCTNESFSVDEYIIANCQYPGTWNGEVERIIQVSNSIITVTRVWIEFMFSYKFKICKAVLMNKFNNGLLYYIIYVIVNTQIK